MDFNKGRTKGRFSVPPWVDELPTRKRTENRPLSTVRTVPCPLVALKSKLWYNN